MKAQSQTKRQSPVYLTPEDLERECRFERLRRSGPGGQNRNKVETAVRFHHLASGLVGEATERRYQAQNRKNALDRLRIEIAIAIRNAPTIETLEDGTKRIAPSEVAQMRWFKRLTGDKIRVAVEHFDYPILVSEFFDVYVAVNENLQTTAELLQTTSSQIVRLLAADTKVLQALNDLRTKRGLKRLTP